MLCFQYQYSIFPQLRTFLLQVLLCHFQTVSLLFRIVLVIDNSTAKFCVVHILQNKRIGSSLPALEIVIDYTKPVSILRKRYKLGTKCGFSRKRQNQKRRIYRHLKIKPKELLHFQPNNARMLK